VTDFKVEQKVRYKFDPPYGVPRTILHIDGNVAMVRSGYVSGECKLIKLVDLVDAEPKPVEPFKPGWYRLSGLLVENFVYYVTAYDGQTLRYSLSYNPKTGEMDNFVAGAVMLPSRTFRGGMTRLKFVDAT
jgi:hypothetical protein